MFALAYVTLVGLMLYMEQSFDFF